VSAAASRRRPAVRFGPKTAGPRDAEDASVKAQLSRCCRALVKTWLRASPTVSGKAWIWNNVVRPRILWRDMPVNAVTRFGAVVEGAFPDVIHSYLYFFGVWEPGITRLCQRHLRKGDVCIDIGANVGAHTLLAAHAVGPTGRVHAIEASPTIYRRLLRNLEINHFNQVRPYNVAVTDKAGPVTVFLHDARNLGATTIVTSEAGNRPTTEEGVVEGRPLADIVSIEEIKAARLIKIDVEGAEWMVVWGMRDILSSLRDDCLVLVEVSADALKVQNETIASLIALFSRHGFEPFEIANSYLPEFYFEPPGRVLSAAVREGTALVDLGFARPATRASLLEADALTPARS
jgi:FkbM family methyltransferase